MTTAKRLDRDALRRTTAPQLLLDRAAAAPDEIAFRSKYRGLYRERRWRDYAELVARMAKVFAALGLSAGERIAIMGDACEEWVVCDLAAQSLGAIVYGIYPTASIAEVEYQMRDGGASIFVAGDQESSTRSCPWPMACRRYAPSSQSTIRRCLAMTILSSGAWRTSWLRPSPILTG